MTLEQLVYQGSPVSATSTTSPNFSTTSADSTNTSLSVPPTDGPFPSLIPTESSTGSDTSTFLSKTDKPRPHVCSTCARSFARLEHLKRHERSHTKEKPFECPQCTRCFARRDLLLRHQQKLHLTTAPSIRTKGRRESTSGVSNSAKVHKSSAGHGSAAGCGAMRPRANTISHIDGSTLELLAATGRSMYHDDMNHGLPQQTAAGSGATDYGLRIDTSSHGVQRAQLTGMRMAPRSAFGLPTMSSKGAMDRLFDVDENMPTGSTVNPSQLHLDEAAAPAYEDDFDWLRGMNAHVAYGNGTEHAVNPASPSVLSHDSPYVGNGTGIDLQHCQLHEGWTNPNYGMVSHLESEAFNVAYGPKLDDIAPHIQHAVEHHYPTPPPGASLSPILPVASFNGFHHSLPFTPLTAVSVSDIGQSAALAVTSITEVTRQALIASLSQHSTFSNNHRRYSQPTGNAPLSAHDLKSPMAASTLSFPSTEHLQRYVSAYIQYFHPHIPFLHIPTLSFDSPAYTNNLRPASFAGFGRSGIVGGGGCLILAMAAVGALYHFDKSASRDLFDAAKKLIQLYLEERRKADLAAASNSLRSSEHAAPNTPLWLVQAMLLNVIYGHQCGDKTSGDIASTHCAALVSLARAAGLLNIPGAGHFDGHDDSHGNSDEDEQNQWHRWIVIEERRRTLFALFHMSSLLVSGYNHAPSIMNSEIHLDLPCDEELWCADSASSWAANGGVFAVRQRALPFASALSVLLTASHNQQQHALAYNAQYGSEIVMNDMLRVELQPSTFGCLVLIDALHNYIWETRQRHSGRPWTTQETEAMYGHMEPALRAWQAAWSSNASHSLERPNPYGHGPLSADCIPLLDLAYVRLFVNLGVSKEAFWARNFDAMAEELARGSEIIIHADHSDWSSSTSSSVSRKPSAAEQLDSLEGPEQDGTVPPLTAIEQQTKSSKRERHLRKAACYAADSLSMSDRLGVTFADFTSRELPIQSAMCAFDCAQVLAEWTVTLQERVGRYLGILGQASIDFSQVPAILVLEEEDCKLLHKVRDILNNAEAKMSYEISGMTTDAAMSAMNNLPSWSNAGYGSQMLLVTAYMLKRAAVWPVTSLMAHGLEVQAAHMHKRAVNSASVDVQNQ